MKTDYFKMTFSSLPVNESFARSAVGVYALRLNPTLSEISDIKTAVSDAVTNSIVHGYPKSVGEIVLEGYTDDDTLHINVFDEGVGIENVDEALEPFYTTKSEEERSGMGFTIMKSFMDDIRVESAKGNGTKVYMLKKLGIDAK
ncbi:MAG: anti-sigma F factor [Clostridia bacterium]|nr:anti-sigma F factor [Clostridia bacterium]